MEIPNDGVRKGADPGGYRRPSVADTPLPHGGHDPGVHGPGPETQRGYLQAACGWLTLALDAISRAEECAQLATDAALERYAGEAAALAQLRLYEIRVERLTLDALARGRETCPTVDPDEGASVG